uniref:Cytochrome b n=1 Tax=Trouessartia rubecula TaxID=474308 RepID=A0A410HYG1_9ACAR|nr:cytochrome b [Trouessartia rubecula]QAB47276.1 cytochrome b [Trouessartia rubecula]
MKKLNIIKKDPITEMLTNSLINLPTPLSITYLWNMGFLLGMVLSLQIITGLLLSMNFIAHTNLAFDSVIHIMRDMDYGWVMRYIHMNGASLFFIFMYIHIARGIYFNSPKKIPMVWASGVILLLLSMMTAFMGYVLPWGQMSFWGATVITSMISAIPYLGPYITTWVWGNFSVSQPTLNRFFSLHFILPMVITALVMIHLILLHKPGSSNPLGTNPDMDKMKFFPYFLIKDTTPLILFSILTMTVIIMNPNMLGDVENFNTASPTSTPTHIQPEWYFLFAYAILRAIPSKLGGVVAMGGAIIMLLSLCLTKSKNNKKFSPSSKFLFWLFVSTVILLTWIGANPVEYPFITTGAILTFIYFMLIISL